MRAVAIVCFFLSGASGLVFEVIWSRQFSLVFGATTLAISTVLTAFMGGLALGSYLAGRIADRLQDPLRAYALAEAGVGTSALLLPFVVSHFDTLNQALYRHFGDTYFILAGFRFLASTAVMVIPTTLMGATLPLLSRYFVQTEHEAARVGLRVGALYAVNTFGAVLGTALGGFVLLPRLGLSLTNHLAAATNLGLALVVCVTYAVRRRLPAAPPRDPELESLLEQARPSPPVRPEVNPGARQIVLGAYALSGALAMIYQVIWTRALFICNGSSVYSFTIVLVTFLVGLAGGAAVISRLSASSRNPVGWLAVNHVTIALLVGVSYLLMDKIPFIFLFLINKESLGAELVLASHFAIALLIMLPATFAMGGIFPLTIRVYASGFARVGADVGNAYSVNTIGAIAGSFLAGFVVIPVLQLQPGFFVAVTLNLLLAITLGWFSPWRRALKIGCTTAALLLVLVGLGLPRWNLNHLSSGLFRLSLATDVLDTGKWQDPKLVFYRDGISTTVSVEQWSHKHYSLKNNGKVDASTGDDMPTQIMVGLLPLLAHSKAPELQPKVALIGLASGVTAGAILQYPVARLDVVELEPSILEASVYFEHVNNRPLQDRRLRVITDDGRNFLAAGDEPYDVIINEPSNPWITGVSNLFTKEYFEIGRRRLRPDGIFCTWAQIYEMSPRNIKSIYRTFAQVFPYVYGFSAEALSSDTFLIGSQVPLKLDIQRLRRAFTNARLVRELARAKINYPDDVAALTLLGPREVQAFVAGAPINTDDNAFVEFGAPLDLFNHKQYDYYLSRIYGQSWLYGRLEGWVEGYRSSEDFAGLVWSLLNAGKFREAKYFFPKVQEQGGPRSKRAHELMSLLDSREVTEEEVALTEGAAGALEPPRAPARPLKPEEANRIARDYAMVEERVRVQAYRAALDLIEGWPETVQEQAGPDFQLLWGYLVYKCLDFHTAVKILEPLGKDAEYAQRRPALLYYLGRSFYGNADFAQAISTLEAWLAYRERAGLPAVLPQRSTGTSVIDLVPD